MRVVLDTNILFQDWFLSSGSARVLLGQARLRRLQLVVPEVVIRETVNKYREVVAAKQTEATARMRELRGLRATELDEPVFAATPDEAARQYEDELRRRLTSVGAATPGLPEGHDAVLDRALKRRKPFSEKGTGYRDTLVWAAVLSLGVDESTIALVTQNWRDFAESKAEPRRLASNLRDDLVAQGRHPDRVRLYESLRQVVEAYVEPAKAVLDELKRRLREDDDFRAQVTGDVRAIVENVGIYAFIDQTPELDLPVEDADIDSALPPESVAITDARMLDDNLYLIEVFAETSGVLSVRLRVEDLARAGRLDDPEIVGFSSDDRYAVMEVQTDLSLYFDGTYREGAERLEDLELVHVSI